MREQQFEGFESVNKKAIITTSKEIWSCRGVYVTLPWACIAASHFAASSLCRQDALPRGGYYVTSSLRNQPAPFLYYLTHPQFSPLRSLTLCFLVYNNYIRCRLQKHSWILLLMIKTPYSKRFLKCFRKSLKYSQISLRGPQNIPEIFRKYH